MRQFALAKDICSTDPLVFNEMGITYYKQENYQQAIVSLSEALRLCKSKAF